MNSRHLIASVLAFTLLAVTAPAEEPKLQSVKVAHWGHEKILIYAPLYIAIDGGFFEREGLDIELVYSGNDDQVFATVLSGAAQFGVGDPAFTAVSREKGGEGKVVAALVGRVANWAVAKDPAIEAFTDPKRLDGLRVTSFPSPSTTFTILSGLKLELGLSKMEIKQLAFGTEQAAIERGEADVAIMLEPQASVAETQGYRVVWSLADYYGKFALTGVTTTDSFIAKDPDTIKRFVSGLQSALTFCAKSPEGAAVILEKSFPTLSPTVVHSATKRMVNDETIPRSVLIDREAWLKTLKVRQTIGDLKSLDVADSCLDLSFAPKHAGPPTIKSANEHVQPPGSEPIAFGWTLFGRVGDFASISSLAILVVTFVVIARKRAYWRKLTAGERECGSVIAKCFPNAAASIREFDLVQSLVKGEGRSEDVAVQTLESFCRAGLLKLRTTGAGKFYEPTFSWLSNSCPLLELWKQKLDA